MTPPPTPNLDKMIAVKHISQEQGLFIDWLRTEGLVLARFAHYYEEEGESHADSQECRDECGWEPAGLGDGGLNALLAKYHGIDYDGMEAERRAVLEWVRAGQK